MFEQSSARDGGSMMCPCPYACDTHSSTQRVRAMLWGSKVVIMLSGLFESVLKLMKGRGGISRCNTLRSTLGMHCCVGEGCKELPQDGSQVKKKTMWCSPLFASDVGEGLRAGTVLKKVIK